jgi:hypothetical protein
MKQLFTRAIALILLVVLCGCGKPAVSEKVETVDTPDAIVSKTINTSSVKNEMTSSRVTSSTVSKAESNVTSKTPNQSVTSSALSSTVSTQQPKENNVESVVITYYEVPATEEATSFVGTPSPELTPKDIEPATDEDTNTDTEKPRETSPLTSTIPEYTSADFMSAGVIYWGGWRWTWYSQNVLPGGGLCIPGRHVDDMGYVCDENDYICLAATSLSKGVIVDTPFGKQGKVYDSGCAYGTLDIYVSW